MTYHITTSNLRQYFLSLLTRRDYSVAELINKAEVKGISGSEVKEVIHWLEENGYVNDKRFAQNIADHYQTIKGPMWIRMKLKQKLIPEHIIDEVTNNIQTSDTTQIKSKVESKYAITDWHDVDPKTLQKVLSFLARQGYTNPYEMVKEWGST